MDLRNFCRKIDVDGIRAKLPAMSIPNLTLSQIKMPKLKSRKIFRSSREDINAKRDTVRSAPPVISPAEFINHTPQRISTISSLMNNNSGGRESVMDKHRGTYRSAYSIDDDYPIATTSEQFDRRFSKPISPVRSPPHRPNNEIPPDTGSNLNTSLLDKLQKGYKDISEFRFKHIFAKKTVVRKDIIQVDNYVERYNEDRIREQQEEERRNREIADNYRFKFKTSHQRSGHTNSLTSHESGETRDSRKKICHESGDESGMEVTPPKRAPPVEPRRTARIHKASLQQNSLTDDDRSPIHDSSVAENKLNQRHLRRADQFGANRNESGSEDNIEDMERYNARSTSKSSRLTSIKSNIQKFQKSIKRSQSTEKTTECSEDIKKTPKASTTEKIAARLRKFKSQENIENASSNKSGDGMQPVQAITTKLKTWKKSFKKQASESQINQTEDEASSDKQVNSNKLTKRLKDIRSRKQSDSDHEEDKVDKISVKKSNTLEDRFTQARQRTLKKMQQINFFHKSEEDVDKDSEIKEHSNVDDHKMDNKYMNRGHISSSRQSSPDEDEYEYEHEEIEEIIQRHEYSGTPKTMWSTNPILSDSMDSDIDCEFPRVVIHQDHSDAYESTLIIAVTRSAMATPLSSPQLKESELKITEIPLEYEEHIQRNKCTESTELMSNKERLLLAPPPSKIKIFPQQKSSIDSTKDIDIWNPNTKNTMSCNEDGEPWKIHPRYKDTLYKTKSIDLFEKNVVRGGLSTAFEDFDDELKNEPIVRIAPIAPCNMDSFENESDDLDETDDDGSSSKKLKSRGSPLKCLKQQTHTNKIPKIGNSRESLITNLDKYEEEESEDDMNRPPSAAPSPPPTSPMLPSHQKLIQSRTTSYSPPHIAAPDLQQQQPPKIPERILSSPPPNIEAPPLPTSFPPEISLPRVPERTTSINRISKPLVKTSSLRLTFDEQVNPSDVGKVNKLITRFEQPKSNQRPRLIPRLNRSESNDLTDDDDSSELTIYESNEDGITTKEDIDNSNTHQRDQSNTPTPATHITTQRSQELLTTSKSNTNSITQLKDNISNNSASINLSSNDRCEVNYEQTAYINIPKISLISDKNSNYSCASSEYGSPPEYPSSLIGSTHTTPVNNRRQQLDTLSVRRSRRSMTRDDEHFFSFDSDEENSYYSISSTGSSRYVVEL